MSLEATAPVARYRLTRSPSRLAATLMGLLCTLSPLGATGTSPFPTLVGNWSGAGRAIMDDGRAEALRCKGYYTSQASEGLNVAIRCANASAKIDLRANLTFANGAVSGNWEERTYNTAGDVTGSANASSVKLAISGGGLQAQMNVAITGASHSVTISTQGGGLKSVTIDFSRAAS